MSQVGRWFDFHHKSVLVGSYVEPLDYGDGLSDTDITRYAEGVRKRPTSLYRTCKFSHPTTWLRGSSALSVLAFLPCISSERGLSGPATLPLLAAPVVPAAVAPVPAAPVLVASRRAPRVRAGPPRRSAAAALLVAAVTAASAAAVVAGVGGGGRRCRRAVPVAAVTVVAPAGVPAAVGVGVA